MVAHIKTHSVALDTYFAYEDAAEVKSEYDNGVVVAMAGASPTHIRITTNLTRLIGNQLEGTPCESFNSDMRVLVQACNAVFYPDLTVVCEPPQFADTRMATLINPHLIIEVLSPSTERMDRGLKADCYRSLEAMNTYILVSQIEPRVELYSRQTGGSWRYDVAAGLHSTLRIETIACVLPLANIYARVVFPHEAGLEITE